MLFLKNRGSFSIVFSSEYDEERYLAVIRGLQFSRALGGVIRSHLSHLLPFPSIFSTLSSSLLLAYLSPSSFCSSTCSLRFQIDSSETCGHGRLSVVVAFQAAR